MKQSTGIVGFLVLTAVGGASAQAPAPAAKTDQTPIVEAVGCLSPAGAGWSLANASDAVPSRTPFTTPDAVKAAAEKPLGSQRYQLLGTSPFSPDRHKGHKMAVRGLLIKSGSETRINVTSFQMLTEACAK